MKQHAAPQMPAVAYARARCAFGLTIAGSFDFKPGKSTTATNLTARRLGMRTT